MGKRPTEIGAATCQPEGAVMIGLQQQGCERLRHAENRRGFGKHRLEILPLALRAIN